VFCSQQSVDPGTGRFSHVKKGELKAVYVAPTKALLQEKMRSWKENFTDRLGLQGQVCTL
jgi:replicative superfamily II helicase